MSTFPIQSTSSYCGASTYSKVSFRKFCIDYNVYTIPYIYTSCLPLLAFETRSRHSSWENKDPSWLDHHALRWAPALCQGSPGMVWRHFEANTGMEPQNNPKVVKSPLPYCTKLSDEKKTHLLSRFHQKAVHFTNSKIKLLAWFAISICSLHWQLLAWRCHNWRWIFKIPQDPDSTSWAWAMPSVRHSMLQGGFETATHHISPPTTHNPSRIHHQ